MKKLFFITTILFSVQSFAQKAITSDNKRLDSLTSSFKTYSVILVVNDSVSEDPVKSNIIVELQRNYSFLKKKKLKSGETDFSILININGIAIGKLDHRVTSRDDRYVTPDQSKTAEVETSYQQRNIKGKQGLSEIWRFEKDFFELFNNYKIAKL